MCQFEIPNWFVTRHTKELTTISERKKTKKKLFRGNSEKMANVCDIKNLSYIVFIPHIKHLFNIAALIYGQVCECVCKCEWASIRVCDMVCVCVCACKVEISRYQEGLSIVIHSIDDLILKVYTDPVPQTHTHTHTPRHAINTSTAPLYWANVYQNSIVSFLPYLFIFENY